MHTQITVNAQAIVESNNTIGADVFNSFIQSLDKSAKTIQTYTKALKQLFKYFYDNEIVKPEYNDLLSFKRDLLSDGKTPSTVKTYLAATRQFFKWTEIQNLYPNIALYLDGVKTNNDSFKKDYLTENQLKMVFDGIDRSTLKGARDYAMLMLMYCNGLRCVEITRANIKDLTTVGSNTVLNVWGKGHTSADDLVIVAPATEKAIREYLKLCKDLTPDTPLFTGTSNNGKGKRLSTVSVSQTVKQYLVKAGFDSDRLTAHSLRHSHVTNSILNGATVQEAQQSARHKNIATTMIYAHNLEKMNNKCSRTLESSLLGA